LRIENFNTPFEPAANGVLILIQAFEVCRENIGRNGIGCLGFLDASPLQDLVEFIFESRYS